MSIKLASRSFATKLSEIGIRKHDIANSNTGTATCFSTRPKGFAFPNGLNTKRVFSNVASTSTVSLGVITITEGAAESVDQNTTHIFTSSGQFNPSFTGTLEYFLVAGGGGGGNQIAGGGGGGGVLYTNNYPVNAGANVYVTIGGGGISQTKGSDTKIEANTVSSVVCNGGGQGATGSGDGAAGGPGGSGGGSARKRSAPTAGAGGSSVNPQPAPTYSLFFGNAGGQGSNGGNPDNNGQGGGGGGAGSVGGSATPTKGGTGGTGLAFVQSPDMSTPINYSAGGGGGTWDAPQGAGPGGNPEAGSGSPGGPLAAGSGVANRGNGGGGGGYSSNQAGGSGGSGFATIRYRSINQSDFQIFIN